MRYLKSLFCAIAATALIYCAPRQTEAAAEVAKDERVFLGGFPIGIALDAGGPIVQDVTGVETIYGTAFVDGLERGDVIISVNGVKTGSAKDISDNLGDFKAEVEVMRNGKKLLLDVQPIKEAFSDKPRLGVKVKEKLYGIGTVSFVRSNGEYAALGHEITDPDLDVKPEKGEVFAAKVLGVKKGERNEAGALLASIVESKPYGNVLCNNKFGIGGTLDCDKLPEREFVEVGGRDEVHPGAAQIKTTVDGKTQKYDIEILKASRQNGKKEKGLVFRVTDKRLLEKTGGVVRGMSGSPIIQNGKLVGAVTHVFLNDFTKGYGVYVDCLN